MIAYYTGAFKDIADLFTESVHALTGDFYDASQRDAWAPNPPDYDAWQFRCELKRPFLFLRDGVITGFLELDTDGHIDCLYVRPGSERTGVGTSLVRHAEIVARGNGLGKLYVEASHGARGLFEACGFSVVRENHVERRGVGLSNWIMEKTLS